MEKRICRWCGIDHIEPDWEIDGEPLCWADDDLCSRCADAIAAGLERDAARYRFLRDRSTTDAAIAAGGVFAGQVPDNLILGGEDLDRAVDAAMDGTTADGPTLEARLADCLADCIDTPLVTVRDPDGVHDLGLKLGSFSPGLADRAAVLLEEAGR